MTSTMLSAPASRMFVPSARPSDIVTRAAENAASSQHAQINLIRMIKSLDKLDPLMEEGTNITRKRDWETVQYARVLLDTLQQSNVGSSSSSGILSDLDITLKGIEIRFKNFSATPTPSVFPPASAVPLPASPTSRSRSPSPSRAPVPVQAPTPEVLEQTRPNPAVLRQRVLNTESYLRNRVSEDRQGDEAGLLPLKIMRVKDQKAKDGRDDLLGGARPGMGSAQLHEELGGQLADMSHRLKLNAVHFANSLEDEKSLLDTSTEVLEKNLAGTRSSKKHLSSVSSKGKGTTCMTLGIVLLVLIIFVWTYLLIRFT